MKPNRPALGSSNHRRQLRVSGAGYNMMDKATTTQNGLTASKNANLGGPILFPNEAEAVYRQS
jgi:hypothetical protein